MQLTDKLAATLFMLAVTVILQLTCLVSAFNCFISVFQLLIEGWYYCSRLSEASMLIVGCIFNLTRWPTSITQDSTSRLLVSWEGQPQPAPPGATCTKPFTDRKINQVVKKVLQVSKLPLRCIEHSNWPCAAGQLVRVGTKQILPFVAPGRKLFEGKLSFTCSLSVPAAACQAGHIHSLALSTLQPYVLIDQTDLFGVCDNEEIRCRFSFGSDGSILVRDLLRRYLELRTWSSMASMTVPMLLYVIIALQ